MWGFMGGTLPQRFLDLLKEIKDKQGDCGHRRKDPH